MLSAKPKAEADNTYWDLDYLGYHSKSHLCPLVRLVCIISSFYKAFEQFSSRLIEPVLKLLFSRRKYLLYFCGGALFLKLVNSFFFVWHSDYELFTTTRKTFFILKKSF